MNIKNPKERFHQSSTFVAEHNKLVDHPAFERALDYAFLHYSDAIAKDDDTNGFYRLQGAREFIQLLQTFHLPPQEMKPFQSKNLQANQ
jgi:hypothetical protein